MCTFRPLGFRRSVLSYSIARRWVPISASLTHMVCVCLTVFEFFSKFIFSFPFVRPPTHQSVLLGYYDKFCSESHRFVEWQPDWYLVFRKFVLRNLPCAHFALAHVWLLQVSWLSFRRKLCLLTCACLRVRSWWNKRCCMIFITSSYWWASS